MKINSPFFRIIKASSLLCTLLCIGAVVGTNAQVVQTHRFEREQKNSDEYYTVISMNEEGLALLREKNKFNGNKKLWELVLLDTALTERKVVEFHIEERYPLIGYEVYPQHLYLLYRTGDTNKNSLVLIDVNTAEGTVNERYEIKPEVDFKITHFSKVGSSLALGGYVSNDPAILLYDLNTKGLKVVPGFFQKDNELVDLRVNENQTFNVLLIDRSQRSERKIVFRTFDESGKLLLEDVVPIDEDKSLQSSISSTLIREDMIVLGTWGDRLGKQSAGFFSIPVDPFQDQKIKYIHFGELQHFLDYLSPKRAERIRHNTKDDLKSGRDPSFTSYVIPYKIEESKEGYFLRAEVYNPVSTANPYYNNSYGNPYYNSPYYYYNPFWPSYYPGMRYRSYNYGSNVKNADEIKTYETVLLAFDPSGNLLWDHSIKLEDVEKPALEQVTDYYYQNGKVCFIYKKKSDLKVKIVDLENNQVSESVEKLMLSDDTDEIRDEREMEGGLKKWTGNTFFVWGYQTIRNQQRKDDRIRDVFYVNKVVAN